ncbi:glycosyltransferase [Metabacillus halosaccharovorans]|uniref:glycosyltransferase n=1 Tax=Metabacillus halosaccharovorans TaxID=930124 RepID=UPI0037360F82
MKILHISGSFPPIKCGVGDYLQQLLKNMNKIPNVDVHLITSNECKDMKLEGVNIYPIIKKWNFSSLNTIVKKVKEINPDVVHIQYPTVNYKNYVAPSFLPLLIRLIGVRKVVQTWHEPLSKKGIIRYLPNILIRTKIINVENSYQKKIPRIFSFLLKRKSTKYIPIGSNIPKTNLLENELAEIRNQLVGENQKNKNIITYFGFIHPHKGVEDLFEAADPLKDIIILICDLNPNNNYHNEIVSLTNSHKWKGSVIVTGFLSDKTVADYLALSDMAIFPFRTGVSERNGSVLAARMQGTFVITTSTNRSEHNNVHDNLLYCEPNNIEALKKAIDLYRYKKIELSNNNRYLSWEDIASEHIKSY